MVLSLIVGPMKKRIISNGSFKQLFKANFINDEKLLL